jgi:hypothetical protein
MQWRVVTARGNQGSIRRRGLVPLSRIETGQSGPVCVYVKNGVRLAEPEIVPAALGSFAGKGFLETQQKHKPNRQVIEPWRFFL